MNKINNTDGFLIIATIVRKNIKKAITIMNNCRSLFLIKAVNQGKNAFEIATNGAKYSFVL